MLLITAQKINYAGSRVFAFIMLPLYIYCYIIRTRICNRETESSLYFFFFYFCTRAGEAITDDNNILAFTY